MGKTGRLAVPQHRKRIIFVIGSTAEDIREGVAHALTGASGLPVHAFCTGECGPVEGCGELNTHASLFHIWLSVLPAWPALLIASWTGQGNAAALLLKAIPLFTLPFRAVIRNEANGFFPLRPGPVANHMLRRLRENVTAVGNHLRGWRRSLSWNVRDRARGLGLFFRSFGWNTVDRAKGLGLFLWSLLWNLCDRAKGVALWLYGLLWNVADWLGSAVLFVWKFSLSGLAHVAALTGPLASRWFEWKFGEAQDSTADFVMLPPKAGSTVDIVLSSHAWPRRELQRLLRRSQQDYLVIRREGVSCDVTPLLALARQTGAFAVAAQSGYAGWRKTALRNHPFRKLEPGEVTEVVAPWTQTVVIRRDALLMLRLPFALTAGAALQQIFWRAAACGWRTLVLASDATLAHEPAMLLEDLEFVAFAPKPAPVRLALQRGNIVWCPHYARHSRALPRILVVSPYLPFPLSHGGAVRIYNLCRALADRFDFVLACFREAGETVHYDELHKIFREVYVVDNDEKHADPGVPQQVAGYRSSAMRGLVSSLCAGGTIDILQLEYTQMAEYRDCAQGLPVILVEHDITFTLHQQLAEREPGNAVAKRESAAWLRFEEQALRSVSAVWAMSPLDRETALEHGSPRNRTFVVPNGVDLRRFQPMEKTAAGKRILFVGSFRHLPNLLAYECLRESILPRLWETEPDVVLQVIGGPDHERAARNAGKSALLEPHPRIELTGFVTDVRPAYAACDVVVIPLPVSAGTNIKLMEAMACGRAVVSTNAGCAGLGLRDGIDLMIREVGEEFTAAILALLQDEDLRFRMADTARRTAAEQFGWERIARAAAGSYHLLLPVMAEDMGQAGMRFQRQQARAAG